jgi:hypothetical protein
MNFNTITNDERRLKAFIGMGKEEFENLLLTFEWNVQEMLVKRHLDRGCKNKFGQGANKGSLKESRAKLLFVLFYLKCYPTYDLLSVVFDINTGAGCRAFQFLKKALEQTLDRLLVLPKRKVSSMKELLEQYPEMKEVFIDGTERRVQRKKNPKHNTKLYSGKKKANTRKNIVVTGKGRTNNVKEILILTKTKSGRRHDKNLADKELLFENLPKEWDKYQDTGFLGSQHKSNNIVQPKKATKNNPLTQEEKQDNQLISSIRITVEHTIGGIKRFNCLVHTYRNKLANFDDDFMLLASGLWNSHLYQQS